MSNMAIRAEHLFKQYSIGSQPAPYKTLREALVEAAATPIQWLRGRRSQAQNTFWALEDVSFEIKHGEAVGIIGHNGAGKSTILKILSRITKPTRGRVELFGRAGSLLEVGTGFHTELTGRENIYLNGAILGMKRTEIERKFDEIVAFSGVEKFLDTPVKYYSSGMHVRLAFSVAAHLEPEILIIDEVLAVGDAEFQKKCLGKMNEITGGGRTVLFVSHNQEAVTRLCQRAILLEAGKLILDGSTEEVFSRYFSSIDQLNVELALDPDKVMPDGGVAWKIDLLSFPIAGDSHSNFTQSKAIVFEDGKKLGPPHALHETIRQHGMGAYSHWGTYLYFSSSDNSDPRSNGRAYIVKLDQLSTE
jgi:lipopolysaccharide transport system ATP-binding protein